jgi:hypothetical protein
MAVPAFFVSVTLHAVAGKTVIHMCCRHLIAIYSALFHSSHYTIAITERVFEVDTATAVFIAAGSIHRHPPDAAYAARIVMSAGSRQARQRPHSLLVFAE